MSVRRDHFVFIALLLCSLVARPLAGQEGTSVDELVKKIADSDLNVRRDAAYELSRLGRGAKDAVPSLIEALTDPDQQV
ncbi:MAG TPA: hypothetical protein EYG57_13895, partial [Planctomycetes bacterium]|nr:hypothetical protein [Planctomycetota bacterium]